MKFTYFGVHGRGLQVRMLCKHTGTQFEDNMLDFPTFTQMKQSGAFKYTQVPQLTLDDGTDIFQTMTIMRYLGMTQGNKDMYPGNSDPLLSYKIDKLMTEMDAFLISDMIHFLVPLVPTYAQKDKYFTNFITGAFQNFLEKLEGMLTASGGPYFFGSKMTIADCAVGANLYRLAGNESYEHYLILRVIVDQYPKVKAFLELLLKDFGDVMTKVKAPF